MPAPEFFHGCAQRLRRGAAQLLGCLALAATATHAGAADAPTLQPGTMAARVAACVFCHGKQGRAGPDGYYPRLAGKPQEYLYHQLLNFRDGRRHYAPMQHLLANLPDAYLHEIAAYFAGQQVPYPAPTLRDLAAPIAQRGRTLALDGDKAQGRPACAACHGASLGGLAPAIPGLLGLPDDYLVSQMGAWKSGLRHTAAPDCMADIAAKLSPDDIRAVASWLAAQPIVEPYAPAAAGSLKLPARCGSQPQEMPQAQQARQTLQTQQTRQAKGGNP